MKVDIRHIISFRAIRATIVIILVIIAQSAFSQTVENFSTSGSWVVPCGVTSVQVEVWGAGGSGGAGNNSSGSGGSGGGGGGYVINTLAVTPGSTINYTIGTGGLGSTGNGAPGGNSTWDGGTITANGGTGGAADGGAVGTGGGGSGGTVTTGSNGVVGTAILSGAGGDGGNAPGTGAAGVGPNTDGNPGTAPGGAGSGGGKRTGGAKAGGNGANGKITITYDIVLPTAPNAGSDQTLAACATSVVLSGSTPDVGIGTWTVAPAGPTFDDANAPGATASNLTIGTNYTFTWTFTSSGCADMTDDMVVTTTQGVGCWIYCNSTHTTGTTYYISNVTFNTINNNTTQPGIPMYNDFTAQSTDLIVGNTYQMSVTAYNGASTAEVYAYFDWNNDGVFTDASPEKVYLGQSAITGPTTLGPVDITVPVTATTGSTVMRIVQIRTADTQGPCVTGVGYGETEDYTVNIIGTPTITAQPVNNSMCVSGSADFEITAVGATPLTYEWRYNGVAVVDGTPAGAVYSGASTSILTVSGAIAAGAYTPYTCYISNAYGNTTSNAVQLTVTSDVAPDPPTLLQAVPQYMCLGDASTLSATYDPSYTLEWFSGNCDGTPAVSPVSPTVTTTYFARTLDGGTGCYSSCASIEVGILDSPTIVTDPTSVYGCDGTPLTFSIVAVGAGLSYQWQEFTGSWADITDGGVYSGATTTDLTISDPAGLTGNQYQCVVSGSCTPDATSAAATINVLASGLSGTKTVGTGGDYTTLQLAFTAINTNGLIGDLELQVISNITETGEASLDQWNSCGNSGYTVTVYPTGAARTISGNIATSLVTMNGADYVTFDGRIDKVGASGSLIFSNTNTAGSTMKFINDATHITVQYCELMGVTTSSTTGVVCFSTGTSTGNDYITIDNCSIHDGATTPKFCIYALGSSGNVNDNVTISNNNIYNAFASLAVGSMVYVRDYNSKWTVSGNSIYHTTSRGSSIQYPIIIVNTSGDDFIVSDNYIGGQAPMCGGSPMTLVNAAEGANLYCIFMDVSNSGVSRITGNTIANIAWTGVPQEDLSGVNGVFAAIVQKGRVLVDNNTIGDNSTGSIAITLNANSTDNGFIPLIYKLGNGDVKNNSIGSISLAGTVSYVSDIYGLYVTGSLTTDVLIDGNIIGNSTVANSIQSTAAATPNLTFTGIYMYLSGSFTTTLTNNEIANINMGGTDTDPYFFGIYNQATAGTQNIIGNKIHDITTASTSALTFTYPALCGIKNNNITTGNFKLEHNQIYSFDATATGVATSVQGMILYTANTGDNIVCKNLIHSLDASSTAALIHGIYVYDGAMTVCNNMIRLGYDKDGNSITSSATIRGIRQYSTDPVNAYFNTIYIGGTGVVSGSVNTACYYRQLTNTEVLKNNILFNARSNTSGTGKHYAVYTTSASNLTSDFNDLYVTGTGGCTSNAAGGCTLADWKALAFDASSPDPAVDPVLVNTTGNASAVDLHLLNDASPVIGLGTALAGLTQDYDSEERADPPTIGADERVIPPIAQNAYGIYMPEAQTSGEIADCEIYSQGGSPGGIGYEIVNPTDVYYTNVNISTYQVITQDNIQCMNTDIDFTTADSSPDWGLGNGSSPTTGSTSPVTTQYTSTGRKDIIESLKIFTGFTNISMDTPDPGSILGAPYGAGCPTTYTYTSSLAGSAGFTYSWSATTPGGCSVSVESPTSETTNITFNNQTGVNQIFIVTLDITSECCGPLPQILRYIDIYPGPAQPQVSGGPFLPCTGGSQTLSIAFPNGSYAYNWYDAATGGTLLGTGTSFTIDPVLAGANYYYPASTNSFGCSSVRPPILVTGMDTPAPTVADATTCGSSDVTLSVSSPGAGYTYNWYSGSCGGTLMQSGTGSSFTTAVGATTTFYVSAQPPDCGVSDCSTPTVTLVAPADPISWLGLDDGPNNDWTNTWFEAANWTGGCIPTCDANVLIPAAAPQDPDIGFSATGDAACKNITLESGATLSFSDARAVLGVCGDFAHDGTVTTNDLGTIEFNGTIDQSYTRTGTGNLNFVRINNQEPTSPTVTIGGATDMIIGTSGKLILQNGLVVTGSNMLQVLNPISGAVIGQSTASYVDGTLRRYVDAGSFDFPVGNTSSYQLMNIDFSSTTANYVTASFTNNADGAWGAQAVLTELAGEYDNILDNGSGAGVAGYWIVVPDGGTSAYDLTLYGRNYSTTDLGFTIVTRPAAGNDWGFGGSAYGSGSNANGVVTVNRTGYTSFSHKAIATSGPVPLPVELSQFHATCRDQMTILNWTTFSEIANDHFTIEKSTDRVNFITVGTVEGSGYSYRPVNYEFRELTVQTGDVYYRLRQTDYNGRSHYSDIISVSCEEDLNIYMFPNPCNENLDVYFSRAVEEELYLNIIDATGRLVYNKKYRMTENDISISLDMSSYSKGLYLITITGKDILHRENIIKQ